MSKRIYAAVAALILLNSLVIMSVLGKETVNNNLILINPSSSIEDSGYYSPEYYEIVSTKGGKCKPVVLQQGISALTLDTGWYYFIKDGKKNWFNVADTSKYTVVSTSDSLNASLVQCSVIDASQGIPIEDSEFSLYRQGSDISLGSYSTDSNGVITIEDLKAGDYFLMQKSTQNGLNIFKNQIRFSIKNETSYIDVLIENSDLDRDTKVSINSNSLVEKVVTGDSFQLEKDSKDYAVTLAKAKSFDSDDVKDIVTKSKGAKVATSSEAQKDKVSSEIKVESLQGIASSVSDAAIDTNGVSSAAIDTNGVSPAAIDSEVVATGPAVKPDKVYDSGSTEPTDGTGTIAIKCLNKSGKVIKKNICMYMDDNYDCTSIKSGSNGWTILKGLEPGTYKIRVVADKYNASVVEVKVGENKVEEKKVTLSNFTYNKPGIYKSKNNFSNAPNSKGILIFEGRDTKGNILNGFTVRISNDYYEDAYLDTTPTDTECKVIYDLDCKSATLYETKAPKGFGLVDTSYSLKNTSKTTYSLVIVHDIKSKEDKKDTGGNGGSGNGSGDKDDSGDGTDYYPEYDPDNNDSNPNDIDDPTDDYSNDDDGNHLPKTGIESSTELIVLFIFDLITVLVIFLKYKKINRME